jgi:enterochelin esterase family protein
MKISFLITLAGLVAGFGVTSIAQQIVSTPNESTPQATPPTLQDRDTQILPDRHVIFRLLAPQAKEVEVRIGVTSAVNESQGTTTTEMAKNASGLWTVTLGPFEPNLYEYQFILDGCTIADPGNGIPKPQRHVNTSLLLIPGTPPDFLDAQNGAHGTVSDETYYSTVLGRNRQVLIYTPPTYDKSSAPLPVLYLYQGAFDTHCLWVTEGRLPEILDNLLAQGKAIPMIVVIPDAHALPIETTPMTSPDFWANFSAYWGNNEKAADEELFHDIIPFIQSHYNISNEARERAIAGFSMGGLQAIGTGIGHLGYFSWVGAFSPVPLLVLGEKLNDALKLSSKINQNLHFFEIVTGDNDLMTGPATKQLESQLCALNIQHVYTVLPGTHSMFVWRRALSDFLQRLFRH